MMEMLEHYSETHEAIFRYKNDDASKEELSKFLIGIGQSLKNNNSYICRGCYIYYKRNRRYK